MNIITNKKLIAVLIIAIMIITLAAPVFAAENTSSTKSKIRAILKITIDVAKEGTKKGIVLSSKIAKGLITHIYDWRNREKEETTVEPIAVQIKFADIAKSCMAVLRENNFYYGSKTYDFKKSPPSASTSTKQIDCSGYVSWVIYEYAKKKGNTTLMAEFETNKNSTAIMNYMSSHTEYFTKVGKLSAIDPQNLKAGDIIVKSGHVEIFGKYDSSKTNKYRCYNAGATNCIRDNQDGVVDGMSGGACNSSTSSYTVYRIK